MSESAIPVVINRDGGTAASLGDKLADETREAFAAAHAGVDLHLVEGSAVAKTIGGLTAPGVAVGGGDGTQGSAAAQLAGSGRALAILPLGTRNHLARQLGIPLKLAEAAQVALAGRPTAIDLAEGNGRVYVHNATSGLYTRLVRVRDRHFGPKWLGTIPAAWHVLRRLRSRPLRIAVDGKARTLTTPLLFVGNNRYSIAGGRIGERESLSEGVLSLFAVAAKGPAGLIAFALRTLIGRADPGRDFAAFAEAREVIVEGEGHIEVAFDGEVELMELPLRFAILPAALKVMVPASPDRSQ